MPKKAINTEQNLEFLPRKLFLILSTNLLKKRKMFKLESILLKTSKYFLTKNIFYLKQENIFLPRINQELILIKTRKYFLTENMFYLKKENLFLPRINEELLLLKTRKHFLANNK